MKKLILILFMFGINQVFAQAILNYTHVYQGVHGSSICSTVEKITEARGAMIIEGSRNAVHIFNQNGDSIRYFLAPSYVNFLARMGNGVSVLFNEVDYANHSGLCGFTMDSNGTIIDTFRIRLRPQTSASTLNFRDSYVDSSGNAVLYFLEDSGWTPRKFRPVFVTMNQLGQVVKTRFLNPIGLTHYSKMIVKDGKLWGITFREARGVAAYGIDSVGLTGEKYYLFKSGNNNFWEPEIIPYKHNGYFAFSNGIVSRLTYKSDIMGQPILKDSVAYNSGLPAPMWMSSDSTRIFTNGLSSTGALIFMRVDDQGNVVYRTGVQRAYDFRITKILCFGDGSALFFGSNWGTTHDSYLFPWVLVRISDMGYPYDPWKQQVVFRGVTGTAKEQTHPTVLAYPNPTQDRLRFMGIAEGNIRLIDATGKELLNQNLTEDGISMAHLPRGLYRYLLSYRGKYYQGSVVKE